MTTATKLTLDEFLALPETEPPSEYICGEVVQKSMPSFEHGLIAAGLIIELGNHLARSGEGVVVPEVRHASRDEQRAYLPDVGVILREHRPQRGTRARALDLPPDLAIEVLSPGDRPGRVAERLAFYLRAGVRLVWIIDPEERTLDAHRPGEPSQHYAGEGIVTGVPVLAEFELDLGKLFGLLDGGAPSDEPA